MCEVQVYDMSVNIIKRGIKESVIASSWRANKLQPIKFS